MMPNPGVRALTGGCYRTGTETREESGHRRCRPGGLVTGRPDPDRWTREAGGAPTAVAWEAVQINAYAETKTKPDPKAKTSTNTESRANTDAENHIGTARGDIMSIDTNQMMGDGPTMKSKEAGQSSPSPDDRLEHGRPMRNHKER